MSCRWVMGHLDTPISRTGVVARHAHDETRCFRAQQHNMNAESKLQIERSAAPPLIKSLSRRMGMTVCYNP